MKKFFGILFAIGAFGAILTITFGFFVFKRYSENLPDYEQLKNYNPIITSRLYAYDGTLISEFSKEKRVFVPIERIPNHVIQAFVAAEDSNFYSHSGIDPLAIARTSFRNVMSRINGDSSMGGASTITQQVVKNFLLTRERTLQRKIKEAILALRMTEAFTKNEILELYLNQIYLGSGAYGVAAAAQTYFNKSIDDLTLEEDALLATLPKAPSKLDPRKNIEKAKIRRDWVLKRMIDEEFITENEGNMAMEQPIILRDLESEDLPRASFFSDEVKTELSLLYGSDSIFENGYAINTTLDSRLQNASVEALEEGIEKYDRKHGYRGALGKIEKMENWQKSLIKFEITNLHKISWQKAVVISLDEKTATIGLKNGTNGTIHLDSLQWAGRYINVDEKEPDPSAISEVLEVGDVIMVEATENNGEATEEKPENNKIFLLRQIPEANGAAVVLDPHSGRVLAMTGGYVDAPNQFNRATQAMRQPGSAMKTFGYIAALENGMNPATIIMDEEISLNQGPDLPPYTPNNYSGTFYGPTTVRMGMEKSRNVTTVRMADQIGLDKVAEVVRRFGVNDNPKEIHSLVLGSTETTALRLATSYAMMVNGGKRIIPSMIEKIQDRNGKTIYRRDKRKCFECSVVDLEAYADENIPELELPVLDENRENVTDSATAYQITSMLEGVVARGTGRRARAVRKTIGGKTGTTNNSYDSWFVGFSPDLVVAIYVGFDIPKSLGSKETGASVALPIFVNFMKEALKDKPSTPFRVPNTIKFVKIDRLTGKIATPSTPKSNIFFESLKIDDQIEEGSFFDGDDEKNEDSSFQDNGDAPSGIY
jgi:penicillin-binding protein 1A